MPTAGNAGFRNLLTPMPTAPITLSLYGNTYTVTVQKSEYRINGTPAISLVSTDGEPFCTVSVNMPDSEFLPPDTFFVKGWSENESIIPQLVAQNVIRLRADIAPSESEFITAYAYELISVP